MQLGNPTASQNRTGVPDEGFQRLLLSISTAAKAERGALLLRLICRASREFFGATGVYLWRREPAGNLVGLEADGPGAQSFRDLRLSAEQVSLVENAIRTRQALLVRHLDTHETDPHATGDHPENQYAASDVFAVRLGARSGLAAPFQLFGESVGALLLINSEDPEGFGDGSVAQAAILAAHLGSLLEAERIDEASREERRRAEILLEFVQNLPVVPDVKEVAEAVADRLRNLLRCRAVSVLLREDERFVVTALAAESLQAADIIRDSYKQSDPPDRGVVVGEDSSSSASSPQALIDRALAGKEPVLVAPTPERAGKGWLLVAPVRTSRSGGAILVYSRPEQEFTPAERSLLSMVAGFGAVAIANAELYSTSAEQSLELHQLLEIVSELGGVSDLEQFLQRFAIRAANFLGFRRSFIGLVEQGQCRARFLAENGEVNPLQYSIAVEEAKVVLVEKQPYWTDDLSQHTTERARGLAAQYNIRQILNVPLLGTDGAILGMLGVIDRRDGAAISREDVRRATALAAQVSMALQLTRNLAVSEQHRHRADDLMALSLDLNARLRLPEFARGFARRAAEMLQAHSAALLIAHGPATHALATHGPASQGQQWETVTWHRDLHPANHNHERDLQAALVAFARARKQPVTVGQASEFLGANLAETLDWNDVALARLETPEGELVGLLCLAGCGPNLSAPDRQLLQALASHASVALQNARLFTRMDSSNRHWVEIFDAISDFIVVHDESRGILRVNRSLAQFIGVRPEELIGIDMRSLLALTADVHPESCPFCRRTDGDVDEFQQVLLERTYLVSTSRIPSAQGEGRETIHVLKDVTDRKEAERRYRELFDHIQEGLYFSTPDGRFIEVNEAMVRMLGYTSREELLQFDITRQLYFDPNDRAEFCRQLDETGLLRNHEETLRRKDGTALYTMHNVFAVRDAGGRVIQYRGLMTDITSLKSFQTELQRERDFNSKILNNTQSLILVVDTTGCVSYANRRWADLDYQLHQLLGRPVAELAGPSKRAVFQDAINASLQGRLVDNLEIPILRADGRVGQFSANLSPMRDEQGELTSIVAVMTDITDAAMLQSKLVHAERMASVGQLVSGVAHEVNNPLTAILGFADLLMENPEIPESARNDLRVILQEAQRTKLIVQNLLSFARQMPPQRKPVQLNAILLRTVQLRAYDFTSHGIEVIEHFSQDLPDVIGDAHQLQQVFLNILNNAYDAVRETGRPARIEIASSPARNFVEVTFRDNGEGVASPDRIFDPFFTTKEVGKGTGLGLSICYGIVREHGGEILCQNNQGGPGATFIVRLPLAMDASLGAAVGVLPS